MTDTTPLLRILIVDDEAPARLRMRTLLADLTDESGKELPFVIVGEASEVTTAAEILKEHHANVLLLDINMPQQTGLSWAQQLVQGDDALKHQPAIIFTTAYDEHALEAFSVRAMDYLVKPVRVERLKQALLKARTFVMGQTPLLSGTAVWPDISNQNTAVEVTQTDVRTHFVVHDHGALRRVPIDDVLYLKAEQKYVVLRSKDREYLMEIALSTLESELVGRYIRIHRNALVNLHYLVGIEKILLAGNDDADFTWVTQMKGVPDRLPISRRQLPLVKEALKAG